MVGYAYHTRERLDMTAQERLTAEARAYDWLEARESAKALFQANLLTANWQPATKQTRLKGLQAR
jgi:hypothetical protein